jgi:hypothetical protein
MAITLAEQLTEAVKGNWYERRNRNEIYNRIPYTITKIGIGTIPNTPPVVHMLFEDGKELTEQLATTKNDRYLPDYKPKTSQNS